MSKSRVEPQAAPDELHLARTENRQLEETIGALRDGLEGMRFDKDRGVQQAVADANGEIAQLKATVTALRDELERNKYTHEGAMAERDRASGDERGQLQQTIVALRKQIENCDAK